MSRDTVRAVDVRSGWQQIGWALPWMIFLLFPIADLVVTPRSLLVRVVAGLGLAAFAAAYLTLFVRVFGRRGGAVYPELVVVAVLGVSLAVWLGPAWSGLLIYVAAAAAEALPWRWVWPVVVAAAAVCTVVVTEAGLLGTLFFLPVMCVLTAFALQGIRYLVTMNAELTEARDELARNAVAEERLRFARDLHDLLGHSLSMIALKSELAGRLAERDPVRAREEMADVETAARRALLEVRDAVSGYRQVSLAQALAEARSALSAAGITLRAPRTPPALSCTADAVLGWVVREATTNVLRHSAARTVTVELPAADDGVELTVTDDGRGPGATAARGAGLSGLAERVQALGGRLDSGAAPGRGFRLRTWLPAAQPAQVPGQRVGAP
jgi:two-component system sensor histidine kinase DesK